MSDGPDQLPAHRPFTVRYSDGRAKVSTDDGRTWRIADPTVLQQTIANLTALADHTDGDAVTTAAADAALAEAACTSPRGDDAAQAPPRTAPRSDRIVARRDLPNRGAKLPSWLADRRTVRDVRPCDVLEVLDVVHACLLARGTRVAEDGAVLEHRAAPSAGGAHGIEVLIDTAGSGTDDGSSMHAGVWWVSPDRDRSEHLELPDGSTLALSEACTAAGRWSRRPPVLVYLVADFSAVTGRYPSGSTLVWRNAGALAATLHLAFGDAGLGSCILGVGGPIDNAIAAALGWSENCDHVGVVGAIAVGRPAR